MGWNTQSKSRNRQRRKLLSSLLLLISVAGLVTIIIIVLWLGVSEPGLSVLTVTLASLLLLTLTVLCIQYIMEPAPQEISEVDEKNLYRASIQHDSMIAVINNLKNAVIGVNPDGLVSIYNAAALSLLDTNKELELQSIDTVLQLQDEKGKPLSLIDSLASTKTVTTYDDMYFVQANEQLRLEVTISPIQSSYTKRSSGVVITGYILIIRDITKAKSLEEEKDEFISVVSHELRTPITVAEGTISNVLAMIDKKAISPGKQKEAIETAHSQVVFLSKMINDLSTLSRAERGLGGEVTRVEVSQLIHDIYNEYKNSAEKKHLHLNLDMPINVGAVMTSELYLKELLQNFISNALKYTEEGSVTICAEQKGETITLSVRDTGIGISKSDQAHIMERFFRSEDFRTRETGGTGLGLYVADKLARKIGTRINLRSRLNHGSTFWIELTAIENDSED